MSFAHLRVNSFGLINIQCFTNTQYIYICEIQTHSFLSTESNDFEIEKSTHCWPVYYRGTWWRTQWTHRWKTSWARYPGQGTPLSQELRAFSDPEAPQTPPYWALMEAPSCSRDPSSPPLPDPLPYRENGGGTENIALQSLLGLSGDQPHPGAHQDPIS